MAKRIVRNVHYKKEKEKLYLQITGTVNSPDRRSVLIGVEQLSKESRKGEVAGPIIVTFGVGVEGVTANAPLHQGGACLSLRGGRTTVAAAVTTAATVIVVVVVELGESVELGEFMEG